MPLVARVQREQLTRKSVCSADHRSLMRPPLLSDPRRSDSFTHPRTPTSSAQVCFWVCCECCNPGRECSHICCNAALHAGIAVLWVGLPHAAVAFMYGGTSAMLCCVLLQLFSMATLTCFGSCAAGLVCATAVGR
eukprot:3317695-Rhodomonas_salina.1